MVLEERVSDGAPREPPEGTRDTRERTREKGSVRGAGAFRQAGGRERDEAKFFSESLILAQNERWQRGLGMQVGRDPEGSNIGR